MRDIKDENETKIEGGGLSRMGNQKGMTLLEIMIVVGLIGGLLAVLGQTIFSNRDNARIGQARIQMSEIGKALEMFYTACNFYPSTDQGLRALVEAPTGDPSCPNWGPEPYIKKNVLKDPWGNEFVYERGDGTYNLTSYGKDGRPGGTGSGKDISSEEASK